MIKNIKSILTENEKMLYDARVHWIVFTTPIFYAFIALLVSVVFSPLIGVVIMVMNLYPIYMATVTYQTTHLILTDKKIIGRAGFLTRDWQQLNIDRIETSYLAEPIFGRMLGYSTVMISGVGTGLVAFPHIVDGDSFVKKLEQVMGKYEQKPTE